MPKYAITLWERVAYDMVVEADDESDAAEAAEAMFVQSGDPTRDFCGNVEERSAGDPEEMPGDTTVTEVNGNGSPPYVLQQAALAVVAAFPEMFTDEPLSGADAVDRLGQVLGELRHALIECGVDVPATPETETVEG